MAAAHNAHMRLHWELGETTSFVPNRADAMLVHNTHTITSDCSARNIKTNAEAHRVDIDVHLREQRASFSQKFFLLFEHTKTHMLLCNRTPFESCKTSVNIQ